MKKLFSVLIPVFNRENLVLDTLNSVKQQTYRPIEIVIVNDGSTDSTEKVVMEWMSQNKEDVLLSLKYISQENSGVSAARNKAILECTGFYIQFLDSDDRIHFNRLERLAAIFHVTGADFIQTGFEGFDPETGDIIEKHYARPNEDLVELALKGLLWANTLRSVFKASLVDKIGPWNTKMTCFEDREYVERAVVNAVKPIAVKDILASARRGGSRRISDRLKSYEGRKQRIFCEMQLCEATKNRSDVSYSSKQAFASRLYSLGFRCNASGWKDLGNCCGDIADGLSVTLDTKGKIRYFVWKSGGYAAQAYEVIARLKRFLRMKC